MRLERVQSLLKEKGFPFTYTEEEGCGSLDFEYRGVAVSYTHLDVYKRQQYVRGFPGSGRTSRKGRLPDKSHRQYGSQCASNNFKTGRGSGDSGVWK